jgi:hypothetical protein
VKKIKDTMDEMFGDANDWTMEKLHNLAIGTFRMTPR